MPLYNSEKTVGMAIESILKQTYKDIILCIIDDASTDNSYKIAKSYTKDRRVIVHRNSTNMGAYYSRNMGLFLNADKAWAYFTTHDADDISYPKRIAYLVSGMRNKRVVAVQDTFVRKRLSDGTKIGSSLTMAHALFKRLIFEEIGYFEVVRFGADWEYWNRMNIYNAKHNVKTASVREVVGESYIHSNNLTVQIPLGSSDRREYVSETVKKHRVILKTNNLYYDFNPKDYV